MKRRLSLATFFLGYLYDTFSTHLFGLHHYEWPAFAFGFREATFGQMHWCKQQQLGKNRHSSVWKELATNLVHSICLLSKMAVCHDSVSAFRLMDWCLQPLSSPFDELSFLILASPVSFTKETCLTLSAKPERLRLGRSYVTVRFVNKCEVRWG